MRAQIRPATLIVVTLVLLFAAMITTGSGSEPGAISRESLDAYLLSYPSGVRRGLTNQAVCTRLEDTLNPIEVADCAEVWDQYGPLVPSAPTEYADNLLIALAEEEAAEDVVMRFARLSERPYVEAELIAQMLLALERRFESCGQSDDAWNCRRSPNDELIEIAVAISAIDHDGQLLAILDGSTQISVAIMPSFGRLQYSTEFRRRLIDRYNYTHDFRYFVVATGQGELDDALLQSAITRSPGDVRTIDQLAYVQFLFDGLPEVERTGDTGLLLTVLRLRLMIDLGLSEDAISIWDELDDAQRTHMWSRAIQSHLGASEEQRSRGQVHRLLVDLASVNLRIGRSEQAYDLIELAESIGLFTEEDRQIAIAAVAGDQYPRPRERISSPRSERIIEFLRQYMNPTISNSETYDLFITGSVGPALSNRVGYSHRGTGGWLWSFEGAILDAQFLAIEFLEERGHDHIAGYLRPTGRDCYQDHEVSLELDIPAFNSIRDSIFVADGVCRDRTSQNASTATRLTIFEEASLPPEHRASNGGQNLQSTQLPVGINYPVGPHQIVRWERIGESFRLIYQSTELDPTGEISGGGYWFVESNDGGRTWLEPLYLGLQQFFPYVVLPQSTLPLIENSRLQIAVSVRALDPSSISFPPIALRPLREEDDLYISAPLDVLGRDQDGDGLTDIYEHRIGMDMLNADSDGDGLLDGIDGLPLTPFDFQRGGESEIARIMLSQVLGHDAGRILVPLAADTMNLEDMIVEMENAAAVLSERHPTLILRGDPLMFAGVVSSAPVIIYDEEMMNRISPDYGVFYPVGFSAVLPNEDRSQTYVIWSAGWVGGEFYIRKNADGEYVVEETANWIT